MNKLSTALLFCCFLRSYMVGAAYNPRGLQNIGFLFAIEPALEALYGPGPHLREARLRYALSYNCHPFFTPMFLGVLLRMEEAIASGALEATVLANVKDTMANTLSAIGDSFFNGTLLSTWALGSACLILAGMPGLAALATLLCFLLLQVFKFITFIMGLKKGMAVLFLIRRLDLINWGDYFKSVNAALLGVLLWLALPGMAPSLWASAVLYLLAAGWVVGRFHAPRVFLPLLLLMLTVALYVLGLAARVPALFSAL